jgi:hypothetical protein
LIARFQEEVFGCLKRNLLHSYAATSIESHTTSSAFGGRQSAEGVFGGIPKDEKKAVKAFVNKTPRTL